MVHKKSPECRKFSLVPQNFLFHMCPQPQCLNKTYALGDGCLAPCQEP